MSFWLIIYIKKVNTLVLQRLHINSLISTVLQLDHAEKIGIDTADRQTIVLLAYRCNYSVEHTPYATNQGGDHSPPLCIMSYLLQKMISNWFVHSFYLKHTSTMVIIIFYILPTNHVGASHTSNLVLSRISFISGNKINCYITVPSCFLGRLTVDKIGLITHTFIGEPKTNWKNTLHLYN